MNLQREWERSKLESEVYKMISELERTCLTESIEVANVIRKQYNYNQEHYMSYLERIRDLHKKNYERLTIITI